MKKMKKLGMSYCSIFVLFTILFDMRKTQICFSQQKIFVQKDWLRWEPGHVIVLYNFARCML